MKGIVELVGIGNFVRLEDGASENRLFIALPNGKQIEAVISDEHLVSVVECFAPGQTQVPPPAPPPPQTKMEAFIRSTPGENPAVFQEETLPSGEQAFVFGKPAETNEAPPVQELAPVVALPRRKSRLIGKDEAGNPIVEVEGESPSFVTGDTGDKDEDGVAQL